MSEGTLPSFQSWRDRLTYLLAHVQVLVAAVLVTAGGLLVWVDPALPKLPDWVRSAMAAVLLLGPPLWLAGMRIVAWLRVRDWVTVYHINAVDDEREKYHVPPALWEDKTVDGPAPYPVNGGAAWEVREFDYNEESSELTVTGTWLSATVDSKLITSKAMLEDVHGSLIERALELSRLRARIEQMGVEIQEATVMELVEASERGTMLDDSAVSEAFEEARREAEAADHDDLPEIDQYSDPADASATAVTDGGTPEHE